MAGKAKIMEHIEEMRIKRSTSWMMEKAAKLMGSDKRNPFQQGVLKASCSVWICTSLYFFNTKNTYPAWRGR